ncbi:MAG TPA: UDP-3-O-(3-hydroxymyristoyl)glucosamine N-acyltransferase [Pyrinomonadaceae bacterium]|nr:UDP-3-O-(3-hydroxymyristoyl)glucosamine N-acyltransferase [Pyrinomonadaceae bacterium]
MPKTIEELAELVNGKLNGDGKAEIYRVANLENAQSGEISFVEKAEFAEQAKNTNASCLLVPENFAEELPCPIIKVKNPKLAFAKIAEILHPPKKREPEIHQTAIIAENAKIGADVFIGAFVCIGEKSEIGDGTQIRAGAKIGDNVRIGENCAIHPNVFIEDNCRIGSNVVLHAGVIIGAEGFGFVRDEERYVKFPQIGTVIIEDEVEIGANSCVDRAALGETRIGKGTKIDNLVQIAHNVQIGERVVIAAQTGISGSTVIEDDCIIGGQVGFGDHARVLKGAIIGSKAGVLPGKIVREGVWWGIPVQPLDEYKRQNAYVKSLPRLREEIKELKKQIEKLRKEKSG